MKNNHRRGLHACPFHVTRTPQNVITTVYMKQFIWVSRSLNPANGNESGKRQTALQNCIYTYLFVSFPAHIDFYLLAQLKRINTSSPEITPVHLIVLQDIVELRARGPHQPTPTISRLLAGLRLTVQQNTGLWFPSLSLPCCPIHPVITYCKSHQYQYVSRSIQML